VARACLDSFGPLVWSLARKYTPTQADAEDAVQDIFLDLWRSASRYDPERSSEPAFVAMIARRRLVDLRRRRARRDGDEELVEDVVSEKIGSTELKVEASLAALVNQSAAQLLGGVVPGPTGNAHPNIVPYGPLRCADTALVLGAGNDAQYVALCAALGVVPEPGWTTNAGRVADRTAVLAALEQVTTTRPAREWASVLEAYGVPCAPVQDLAAVQTDPQLLATGQLTELAHPAGPVTLVGSPLRLDGARPRPLTAPPLLGQHTVEVLTGLGLSPTEVQEVIRADRR